MIWLDFGDERLMSQHSRPKCVMTKTFLLTLGYWSPSCSFTLDALPAATLPIYVITGPPNGPILFCSLSASSVVVCNAAGGRVVQPPGVWAFGWPTLHGGPVRLRPVRTLCWLGLKCCWYWYGCFNEDVCLMGLRYCSVRGICVGIIWSSTRDSESPSVWTQAAGSGTSQVRDARCRGRACSYRRKTTPSQWTTVKPSTDILSTSTWSSLASWSSRITNLSLYR